MLARRGDMVLVDPLNFAFSLTANVWRVYGYTSGVRGGGRKYYRITTGCFKSGQVIVVNLVRLVNTFQIRCEIEFMCIKIARKVYSWTKQYLKEKEIKWRSDNKEYYYLF